MKREHNIRLQILREAQEVSEGTGLGWHDDRVANEVACEMISEGLVLGSVSEHGIACITGIRDIGIEYLENQKPRRQVIRAVKRVAFVLYSFLLLLIGYVLNLDSVKTFFSEMIGRLLK